MTTKQETVAAEQAISTVLVTRRMASMSGRLLPPPPRRRPADEEDDDEVAAGWVSARAPPGIAHRRRRRSRTDRTDSPRLASPRARRRRPAVRGGEERSCIWEKYFRLVLLAASGLTERRPARLREDFLNRNGAQSWGERRERW
jgi:hypothetical protein